jgi:hypothetical protein
MDDIVSFTEPESNDADAELELHACYHPICVTCHGDMIHRSPEGAGSISAVSGLTLGLPCEFTANTDLLDRDVYWLFENSGLWLVVRVLALPPQNTTCSSNTTPRGRVELPLDYP